jgi:tetratricopeptide (TPR) repeat protein
MKRSWLKGLWDAVKPPPAPRQPYQRISPTLPPWYKTFWRVFLPPPKAEANLPAAVLQQRRRRRRVVLWGASLVAAGGCAWGAYLYTSSAPSRADKAFQRGMTLMGKDDFQGAERQFTRATEIWPQLANAFVERGLARRAQQNIGGAAADFEHAIALEPSLDQAHTELGLIYRERGNLDRALNEFTLSIQIASNTDALYQRGQLYASLGQHEKAVADYDAAIHQQTGAPYVYRARAMSRDALGDHDGAENDRQTASSIEHR